MLSLLFDESHFRINLLGLDTTATNQNQLHEWPVAKVSCKVRHCSSVSIESYVPVAEKWGNIFEGRPMWTKWFSNRSRAECPGDSLVNQVQCRGKHCKEVLSCRQLRPVLQTESRGYPRVLKDVLGQCPNGSFVKGTMACRGNGDFSSKKKLFYSIVKYDENGRGILIFCF